MKVYGKNILIELISEKESEFQEIINKKNPYQVQTSQKGIIRIIGEEVDLKNISINDSIVFKPFGAIMLENNQSIISQEQLVAKL